MSATWSGAVLDTTLGTPLWTNTIVQELTGNVDVPAGRTLTIQAGTSFKVDVSASLTLDGNLIAQGGSENQTIDLTSIFNRSVGGDGNGGHLRSSF